MQLAKCLAKTELNNGIKIEGMNVKLHCLMVGYATEELLSQLYDSSSKLFSHIFGDYQLAIKYLPFISALHDLGKVSPTFQYKILRAIHGDEKACNILGKEYEEGKYSHNVVSKIHLLMISNKLKKNLDALQLKSIKKIAEILDRHHGYNSNERSPKVIDREAIYGEWGSTWSNSRNELIVSLYKSLVGNTNNSAESIISELGHIYTNMSDEFISCVSGLICVSDWIASSINKGDIKGSAKQTVINKVIDSGFVGYNITKGLTFSDIYGWQPRLIQQNLIDMVTTHGSNKVYVLEADTGIGKTEAALYAAYKLLENNDATGIYFGMPTQLTSNKIHERVDNPFLKKCFDSSYHGASILNHSNSSLMDWGGDALPNKSWYSISKKRLLSPFAVGTADQAVMSTLKVKHSFVRSYGLMGKVIILDEVHSYDSYTGYLMKSMIDNLLKHGCTIIILSATLTTRIRNTLLGTSINSNAFPLVSCSNGAYSESEIKSSKNIDIEKSSNDLKAFETVISEYKKGLMILWVENTIKDAQDIYEQLKSMGVSSEDIGLLHSGFTVEDRNNHEELWISKFGVDGDRSKGCILIGTQVVEQSIDIDADFLITRECPMDMLLQRIGRLWRHEKNNSTRGITKPKVLVLDAIRNYGKMFGNSELIYGLYPLLKTRRNLPSRINIPNDIRALMSSVYESDNIDMLEEKAYSELFHNINDQEINAKQALSSIGTTRDDDTVYTRINEVPQCSLILLKSYRQLSAYEYELTMYNGEKITTNDTRRNISKCIQNNTVKVKSKNAPLFNIDWASWISDYIYIKNNSEPMNRLVTIKNGCIYQLDGTETNCCYNKSLGYHVISVDDNV